MKDFLVQIVHGYKLKGLIIFTYLSTEIHVTRISSESKLKKESYLSKGKCLCLDVISRPIYETRN